MANIVKNPSNMDFPLQIARQYDAPIEKFEVFYSLEDAQNYAKGSPAYVGQTIKVVNESTGLLEGTYNISDKAGTLVPVATGGDASALEARITVLEGEMDTAQADITELDTKVGTADLTTTAKDLSGAVNELKGVTDTLDTTTVKTTGSQVITGDLTIKKEGASTGNLVVDGDLTVKGNTVTESQETLLVKDNMIVANSEGASLTQLSGLAIRKDATDTYGIVYDPTTSSVNLGLGNLDSSNEFTFNEGEGAPIVVRDLADDFTNGHLIMWKGEGTKIVDADIAASDIALKSEIPTQFDITGTSNILQVTGGENSLAINAQTSEDPVSGKLTLNAAGKLDFGGSISANGVVLTGNTGTVTSVVAGDGLGGGTINSTGTITHAIPEGAAAKDEATNTGATIVQDILSDKFGHVVGTTTKTLTAADLGALTEESAATAGFYKKPSGGIPKTDLESAVQTSLGKADTAVQPDALNSYLPLAGGTLTGTVTFNGTSNVAKFENSTTSQVANLSIGADGGISLDKSLTVGDSSTGSELGTDGLLITSTSQFKYTKLSHKTITLLDSGTAPEEGDEFVINIPLKSGTLALSGDPLTHALTFGSKSYDGTTAQTITAADLGAASSDQVNALIKYEAMSAMTGDESNGYTYTSTSVGYAPVAVYRSDGAEVVVDKKKTETGYVIYSDIDISGGYVLCNKVSA